MWLVLGIGLDRKVMKRSDERNDGMEWHMKVLVGNTNAYIVCMQCSCFKLIFNLKSVEAGNRRRIKFTIYFAVKARQNVFEGDAPFKREPISIYLVYVI